ncbi:galactose-3-O-sulfotransferase 2-like [Hydractinia symbiolongicarpus]|uniref:galactose-3-O-sulfotransferase 2-like n=1 Tax=Hydractinia symbiolongicarpus TaxID=13093 RepID=UPI00254F9B45|nr:galactose-3-O-sulfotransferase 2-like [Hydractinia symbiolongicarpus]
MEACGTKMAKLFISVFRWKCARLFCLALTLALIVLGVNFTDWYGEKNNYVKERENVDISIRTKVSQYSSFEHMKTEDERKYFQQFTSENRWHKKLIAKNQNVNAHEKIGLPREHTLTSEVENTYETTLTDPEERNFKTTPFKPDITLKSSKYDHMVSSTASQNSNKNKGIREDRTSKVLQHIVEKGKNIMTQMTKEGSPMTRVEDLITEQSNIKFLPDDLVDKILNNRRIEQKKCKPIKNVIFLKTHKTGSSTIINIMQRISHRKNLSIALPGVNHFLGWPKPFLENYIFEHETNKTYNIICNHARFNKQRMLKVMSSKNTKIVTIIRDPLYQFESSAVYLNFNSLLKLNRSKNVLDAFFAQPEEAIYNRTLHRNSHNVFLLKNPIAFDLGFRTWIQTEEHVQHVLNSVKKDFNLVMISDYMEESLILLKNELCWDMKDVLYFTMNKRPDNRRQKIQNIAEKRMKLKRYNKLDYSIFEYYNKTFWEQVKAGGETFQNDVKILKAINKMLADTCLHQGRHFDKSQWWFPILGYKLKVEAKKSPYFQLCEDMTRSEIDFTNMLKLKSTKRHWTIPTRVIKTRMRKYKTK